MNRTRQFVRLARKSPRGVAIFLVLSAIVVFSFVIYMLIESSGSSFGNASDMRQKLRARMSAEAALAISMADLDIRSGKQFGSVSALTLPDKKIVVGTDTAFVRANMGDTVYYLNTEGKYRNLVGIKFPLQFTITTKSMNGKSSVVRKAEVSVQQIPMFQFGMFGEKNLGHNPGGSMNIGGRVHANGDMFFGPANVLNLQGPITAVGSIHWKKRTAASSLDVWLDPNDASAVWSAPGLVGEDVALTASNGPASTPRYRPMEQNVDPIQLPIEATSPMALLDLRTNADPPGLKRQKFDRLVGAGGRFVAGVTAQPTWIVGPKVFFNRQYWRWMKYYEFDIAKLKISGNKDSIFYLADTTFSKDKRTSAESANSDTVVNAFVVLNGNALDRNLTIATYNDLLVVGDYNNTIDPVTNDYHSAMLAGYNIYHLSDNWNAPGKNSIFRRWTLPRADWGSEKLLMRSLERHPALPLPAPLSCRGAHLANAGLELWCADSILDIAKTTIQRASLFGAYGNLLEYWPSDTIYVKGSLFSPDPDLPPRGGGVRQINEKGSECVPWPWCPDNTVYSYSPWGREFGWDPRLSDLTKMPPGTPFFTTTVTINWLENN